MPGGCAFKYVGLDTRPKTCNEWSFDLPSNVLKPVAVHSTGLLTMPAVPTTFKVVDSPYGPGTGTHSALQLRGAPYIQGQPYAFNFADFTLAAWVNIPDLGACQSHCSVAGRFKPKVGPLAKNADQWYDFGYWLSVTNVSTPTGALAPCRHSSLPSILRFLTAPVVISYAAHLS